MLKERTTKTNLIVNSLIDLKEDDGNGKGRYFVSRFIEPGLAHYKELGDIVITKETLDKFIQSMVGCPVIIDHKDVTDKNVDKLRVGTISRVWFSEQDGWYYCEGILTDDEAIDLVKNQGWNVSCSYSFISDDTQKTYHGKPIDMVFTDGEFLHLAIVEDPRYEGANIVVNKKDDDLEWITVKGNHIPIKKGRSKDEAVKEFLESKKEGTEGKEKGDFNKGDKVKADTNWRGINPSYVEGEIIDKRKILAGHGDTNPEYEYLIKSEDGKEHWVHKNGIESKQDKKESSEGKASIKTLKDDVSSRDFAKFLMEKKLSLADYEDFETNKKFPEMLKEYFNLKEEPSKGEILELFDGPYTTYLEKTHPDYEEQNLKNNKAKNNIGDITMTVLNDLTDFIKKVVKNEKEDEMAKVKNEDKRKLIDEIGGILKGKVDDEIIRTVIKKAEELSYEPSEDDKADNKCKNEEEDKDEAKNKCKNEEEEKIEEKEEKVEDEDDDEEDVTKNKKVKNSLKDVVMGGNGKAQEQKLYVSRKERLEEGNKY